MSGLIKNRNRQRHNAMATVIETRVPSRTNYRFGFRRVSRGDVAEAIEFMYGRIMDDVTQRIRFRQI